MLHRYPTVTPHSYIMALQDAYYWLSLHDLIFNSSLKYIKIWYAAARISAMLG